MTETANSESFTQHDDYSSDEDLPKSLRIPRRRFSLRNARPGNLAAFDLSDLWASLSDETTSKRLQASILEEDGSKTSGQPSTSKSETSPASARADAIFSPGLSLSTMGTPHTAITPLAALLSRKYKPDPFTTPTKRRAISCGNVIDTPPRSMDRFIPNRSRGELSISNYRTSKLMSELSLEQKQMRLDGADFDPFMARRVTPHLNGRRNLSGSSNPQTRAISTGGIWNPNGSAARLNTMAAVHSGSGAVLESGTNARMFNSDFFKQESPQDSHDRFEARLAMALDLDQSGRVLDVSFASETKRAAMHQRITTWKDGQWMPPKWKNILDAPSLKDDFYCTLLAYCPSSKKLAVALNNRVYLWTETDGVHPQHRSDSGDGRCSITSLSFSSPGAGKCILAIGRNNGRVNLWCIKEPFDRIQHTLPVPVACLAFKPVSTRRFSARMRCATSVEDLLVGDEAGNVYYYAVEWPEMSESHKPTSMVLLAKLSLHNQQVCGLAWSSDGECFASGGNDNACYILTTTEVLGFKAQRGRKTNKQQFPVMSPHAPEFVPNRTTHQTMGSRCNVYNTQSRLTNRSSLEDNTLSPAWKEVVCRGPEVARHRWLHTAAVKAIAFCPWQKGLIATGGGSNDRAIHFFHIGSGACLATINVYAQVTSLIWSKTKREICATFGYSAPEHPFRIAVYSWPDCRQVVRIPWKDKMRALYAIAYPGGPNEENKSAKGKSKGKAKEKNSEGGVWWSRTKEEGCIVVASSDQSVKFHEVWSGRSSTIGPISGGLAWSSILESEEGGDVVFKDNFVIR